MASFQDPQDSVFQVIKLRSFTAYSLLMASIKAAL